MGFAPQFPEWDDAIIAQVRQWAADGVSQRAIAGRLGMTQFSAVLRMRKAGIKSKLHQPSSAEMERGAKVLRAHFTTAPDLRVLLQTYHEARGHSKTTIKGMRQHARSLGLLRPENAMLTGATMGAKAVQEKYLLLTAAMAPSVQAALDEGLSLAGVSRRLKTTPQRIKRMAKKGLVTIPPQQPRPPAPPRVFTPRVAKPKPPKPERPKALPKSWVRTPAEPPKPRAVFQTVDEWVKAGGIVTRCPAAVLAPTTHTPSPEDAEALRAYYAAKNAQESGTWKQRAKKKMGRIFYGKAAV